MGSVETTGKTMRAAVTASFLVMCAIILLTIAPNSRHSALGSEFKSEKAIDSLDLSRSFRSALRAHENGFFRRSHVTKGATVCVGGGCFGSKPAVVLEKPFELFEHDATDSSLTMSWYMRKDADYYELQMQKAGEEGWSSIFNGTGNFARKKNLDCNSDYSFRLRYRKNGNFSEFSPALNMTTLDPDYIITRMSSPNVEALDGTTVRIVWDRAPRTQKSEIQIKSEDGGPWVTVSDTFSGASARKKGLKAGHGYLFRTRGFTRDSEVWGAWSEPTGIIQTMSLHPTIKEMFGDTLTNAEGEKVSTDALAGKVVGIYFSAHWCPPCRQFTPMLAEFYKQAKQSGSKFEIVFISSDQDGYGFRTYLESMPWLAVPFRDMYKRHKLASKFEVRGIPCLKILNPKGEVVCEDGVRTPLSSERIRTWERS